MNKCFLRLIGKLFGLLFILVAFISSNIDITEQNITVNNYDKDKGSKVISTVVEYETIINYSSKIPVNNQKVLTKGEDGLVYKAVFAKNEKPLFAEIGDTVTGVVKNQENEIENEYE